MKHLAEEITETCNLIQETADRDVRDALRVHLDGLLELRRQRIARSKGVDIRLGDLVHPNQRETIR